MFVLAIGGCTSLPPDAAKQVNQGKAAFDGGRYADCDRTLTAVLNVHSANPAAADAFYYRGLARTQLRQRDPARRDLDSAARLAKDPALRALAHAQLGNLDFDDQRYGDAIRHYRAARPDLPASAPIDRILYQYGVALERTGASAESRQIFAELTQKYPSSPFAVQAGSRRGGANVFSIQCGVFNRGDLAQQAAGRLRGQGFDATVVPDGGSFKVRVGRYRTYAEASAQLPRVRRVQPDAFIVP